MQAHAHDLHDGGSALNRTAALATLHCLTGCAIGEVLGMVLGTALGWSNAATIALAVTLAFAFGYSLTMLPLLRAGLAVGVALPLAFASDSFSIAVMELVDNGVMLAVPGAMDAPLTNPLFWGALALALGVAYVVAFPVNRYLIARGAGHAVVHHYHHGGEHADHAALGADEAAAPGPGSPLRFVVIGLAAVAVTIGAATGGALFIESRHDESGTAPGGSDMPVDAHGEPSAGHEPREAAGTAAAAGGLAVSEGAYTLAAAETRFTAGRAAPFSFRVVGADGAPVTDMERHGGVRMHLVVVPRDLSGYRHQHPTLAPDGSWRTTLRLPRAGVYRAFADFERDGEKHVLGTDLFAAGRFRPAALPAPAPTARVDGYRVDVRGRPRAGARAELAFSLSRGDAPVDVEPYLGAAGHLVALRAGDLAYLHAHPLREQPGEVRFQLTFPAPGTYRLFLQFRDRGSVHTAPLTLRVARGG